MKSYNRKFDLKTMLITMVVTLMPTIPAAFGDSPAAPPAKVVVEPVVEKMVAENTPIVGIVYFEKVSNLSPEVSGRVESVRFKEGDRVCEDDILVNFNTDFIDKDIEEIQTRMIQIDVHIEKADKDLKRYETLFCQEAASEKDYDDLKFTRRDLIQQKKALEKKLDIAQLKKNKSVIRAPFKGIILEKHIDIGNWVSPGTALCRIGSVTDIFVKVPIAEELMIFSQKGDTLDIDLHAFGKTVTGHVNGIVPVADPKTKNIMLKIRLPHMETAIENLSASVRVPTSQKKQMKLISRDALVSFQGKQFVFTLKDDKAAMLPINVLTYMGKYAGVESPQLKKGMMVVTDGNQRLRPDQPAVATDKTTSSKGG
ncbi:MAG: efflux RND transporter periplasmic adaptor subunit [Desulfobacterales bacterium]|nr:efflux RND transporter periplasmic adaptor subunit [Desulfobacterales bacterium]